MKQLYSTLGLLALLGFFTGNVSAQGTTTLTFEDAAAGNNYDIPLDYGSFIAGPGTGFVTTGGATPKIGLTWLGNIANEWEYHTASAWLHETPVYVAQLNFIDDPSTGQFVDNTAEIVFSPIDGRSVVINSFLLSGANDRPGNTFDWEVVGTAFSGTETVGTGLNTGTINVGFTGQAGVSYTLRFTRQPDAQIAAVGTALDDLSFGEVLLPTAEVVKLTVNRSTGNITINNIGSNAADIIGYSITSSTGALDQGGWTSIKDNYDVNGDGSVDSNDAWTVLPPVSPNTELTEFQFGGDGGSLATTNSINLGNGWIQSLTEDLQFQLILSDNRVNTYSVEYVGGPAGEFEVGDLNFDGTVNALDWPIYNAGRGVDFSGESPASAYQLGDLDGDFDNDISDFLLFKALFVASNGEGSFEAMLSVPEPGTALLSLTALASLFSLRPRRSAAYVQVRRDSPRSIVVSKRFAVVAFGLLAVLAFLTTGAQATVLTFADSPGNNTDLPEFYGSNIAVNSAAFVTTDGSGATPNIGLTWGPTGSTGTNALEFHSASTFAGAGFSVPVLQFDVDGSAQPGGTPPPDPTIDFTATDGFSFRLNSFEIGNATDQTTPAYRWNLNLIRLSDMTTVATRTTSFLSAGDRETVVFDYTGDANESYRLLFDDEGADQVRTGIDNLSFSQVLVPTPQLKLLINTVNGSATIVNDSGSSFTIDSYEIKSASNSLDPGGWNSLQDQDYEGNGSPGTGNGWEEAGGSDDGQLIESYLLGDSTIVDGVTPISLGSAFDISGQQDIEFVYHEAGTGSILRVGIVEYVSTTIAGDYNNNGSVDAADYTVWRDGNSPDSSINGYNLWVANFGNTSSTSSSESVPEPNTLLLCGMLLLGLAVFQRRRSLHGRRNSGRLVLQVIAAAGLLAIIAQPASAAVTVDRSYLFGEDPSENPVAGAPIGTTRDSVSIGGGDQQNLTGSGSARPTYVNVGPSGLARPGASNGDFGAQFDGINDRLIGDPLNRPDETAGPTSTGIGPLLSPFPFNYDEITARGLQVWVYPDADALGNGRQGVVFDTIAAGGISITADGMWTQTNDSKLTDGLIGATVPVVGDQWYHVMQQIYSPDSERSPKVLALGGGASFTSVLYVNGIAVSANNGTPSPGELDNGDRIGVLALGGEEVESFDFVTPETINPFKGTIDDLEMYVFGDNSSVTTSPAGQNYGTFNLFEDNAWIADQVALIPGGVLQSGDINRDGNVNASDVTAFVAGWRKEKRFMGSTGEITAGDWETWGWGDLNLDGTVDLFDAIQFNQDLIAAGVGGFSFALLNGSVPEPTSLLLVSAGMMTMALRRRSRECVETDFLNNSVDIFHSTIC